jgi:predicted ribosome quality control (RQC) complex YloA/Tae2 family protein
VDYRELDAVIDRLEKQVETTDPQKGYWKELWELVHEIGGAFKRTRYETKGEKDAAWKRFQALCDQAKQRSDQSRRATEERQREWQRRKETSDRTRARIEGRPAGARPVSGLEKSISEIVLFPLTLIEKVLNRVLGLREKTQFEEAREELKQCSRVLKEAWETFTQNKNALLPADKAKCFQTLNQGQQRLNEAWASLKSAQDNFYAARRAQWEARQREREEKQRQWEQKQREFRSQVQANIEKLEEKLDRARNALSRQEAHLDKLER